MSRFIGRSAAFARDAVENASLFLQFANELVDLVSGRREDGPRPGRLRLDRTLQSGPYLPRVPSLAVWWPLFIAAILENFEDGEDAPVQPSPRDLAPGFPSSIPVFPIRIQNFDGRFELPSAWHAIPWTEADLVELAAWAVANDYQLRPLGNNHSWSPMQPCGSGFEKIVFVDLKRFRTMRIDEGRQTATFSAAVTVEEASRFLDRAGFALPISPAVGEVTLGGVLAIGGHGTGVDEGHDPGATIGHQVTRARVLGTRAHGRNYEMLEFDRDRHPDAMAVLSLNLGCTLVTEITLRIQRSRMFEQLTASVSMRGYFGTRGRLRGRLRWPFRESSSSSLHRDLQEGPKRLELMWLPHQGIVRGTEGMRLIRRGWRGLGPDEHSADPETEPYRDRLVNWAAHDTDVAVRKALRRTQPRPGRRVAGERMQTMLWLSTMRPDGVATQHAAQLYSSRFILRFHAASWCLIVDRPRIGELLTHAAHTLMKLQERGAMSLDGPVEIRITNTESDGDHAVALSPARTPPGRAPETLYAVWFTILTDLDHTDHAGRILHEFERWLFHTHEAAGHGLRAVRPEWSKGAAYDVHGRPWRDPAAIAKFRAEYERYPRYNLSQVVAKLDTLDAHALFRSPLANVLFLAARHEFPFHRADDPEFPRRPPSG